MRVEQLYPFPQGELAAVIARYDRARDCVWCQEEPMNQGALQFISVNLTEHLDGRVLHFVSRPPSASPATGSHKAHEAEQAQIVADAIGS